MNTTEKEKEVMLLVLVSGDNFVHKFDGTSSGS